MRYVLLIPAAAAITCLIGMGLCAASGWNPHRYEMISAALIACIGAGAGLLPALLLRSSVKSTVSMAGLAGTALQMLLTLMLAAVAMMGGIAGAMQPFSMWLLVMYWTMLATVVIGLVAAVRDARPDEHAPHGAGGKG